MRRVFLVAFLLSVLAVPVASSAKRRPDASGSLSIRGGRGEVVLQVKGAVIGRLANGKLTLTDADPYDEQEPDVRGRLHPRPRAVTDATTVYEGRQIRFRVLNGSYRLKIDGTGINLSGVGRGWVVLDGDERFLNTGAYALNGAPYLSIPYERTERLKIGGSATAGQRSQTP
jgi:hypothetical protein